MRQGSAGIDDGLLDVGVGGQNRDLGRGHRGAV
jgi:hypothetical protein